MNIITSKKQVISKEIIIKEPEILISGETEKGTRCLTITFRRETENGDLIDTPQMIYAGADFNLAYAAFQTDKGLIEKALRDLDIQADLTALPADFTNPGEVTEE